MGPGWWGDRWRTRDGGVLPLDDPELRAQRKSEAEAETAGLIDALAVLPAQCLLMLAGDSGATLIAHRWAEPRRRQMLVVPDVQPGSSWPAAAGATVGLATVGWKVKALVCAIAKPASMVDELVKAGVYVRVVEPAVEPESQPAG